MAFITSTTGYQSAASTLLPCTRMTGVRTGASPGAAPPNPPSWNPHWLSIRPGNPSPNDTLAGPDGLVLPATGSAVADGPAHSSRQIETTMPLSMSGLFDVRPVVSCPPHDLRRDVRLQLSVLEG